MTYEKKAIVAGIPSYNEADNIARVAHQVSLGLRKYFPENPSVIINVDNASEDGTKEAFLESDTGPVEKVYISTEKGVKGKGNNFLNLFKEVKKMGPCGAVVVVDADLKSITPEWIKALAEPVMEGYDFVTPIYSRNRYDGTITNHICYPLLYGLFNTNIRQPIAGEFAFSTDMVDLWLGLEWSESIRQYGIDIFMTTSALLNGFRRCQVVLGTKIHKPSAPKLGPMFTQVVTTLFDVICRFKDVWTGPEGLKDSPLFGDPEYREPQNLDVDYRKLLTESIQGFKVHRSMLKTILPPLEFKALERMCIMRNWDINARLWAKIIYDFILAYDRLNDKSAVIEALKPLYFARVASFYVLAKNLSSRDAETEVIKQAEEFKNFKRYILERIMKDFTATQPDRGVHISPREKDRRVSAPSQPGKP